MWTYTTLDNTSLDLDLKIIIKAWYVVDLMQLSDLLDNDNREVDLSKTRIKVTNFMENQYQQLKYLANISPLNSVNYDNVKVQTSPSNSIESKAIKQLQAKEYLRIIDDCINSLDDIQAKIFKYKLLEHRTEYDITELTGYSRAHIYNIYKKSCVEFAKHLRLVTDIDLLEYKET
ncbi:ArpU family phage packaging/lysis transcriptional regulator [Ligilactobacillus salivarius]